VTIGPDSLVLLDTSVVIHLARNDVTGQAIECRYSLTSRRDRPLISTVTEGELLGFAYFRRWGQHKLEALRTMLDNFVRVDAGLPAVVEWYAQFHAEARHRGTGLGQNDLWIAATARAAGAVLLTCDRDFEWLHPHICRCSSSPQRKMPQTIKAPRI
jgi:tRNA(fMet)-specific endonuclease VapC